MAKDHSGFSLKSPAGVGLALGAVLTELIDLLIERGIITHDDANHVLRGALDGLGKSNTAISHIDATALINQLIERLNKGRA